MNTARAFGPAVVTGFPESRHWVVALDHPDFIDLVLTSPCSLVLVGPFLGIAACFRILCPPQTVGVFFHFIQLSHLESSCQLQVLAPQSGPGGSGRE
jgi:hypothetical protein